MVVAVLVAICRTLITRDTKQEQALLSNSGGCVPALPGAKAGGIGERLIFGKAEAVVVKVFVVKLTSVRKCTAVNSISVADAYTTAVTVEVASQTLAYEDTVAFTTVVETVVTAMYWLQKAFALEQYRSS